MTCGVPKLCSDPRGHPDLQAEPGAEAPRAGGAGGGQCDHGAIAPALAIHRERIDRSWSVTYHPPYEKGGWQPLMKNCDGCVPQRRGG